MLRSTLLASAVSTACSIHANAATLTMICENPRREYVITFDEGMNSLHADDTPYRILAVEKTSSRLVVAGLTVNEGPTFRPIFDPTGRSSFLPTISKLRLTGVGEPPSPEDLTASD